jgi:enoyl-CoA hydratase/carnithine racemase
MEPELLVEDAEGIRTVTLNRPQAMNALTDALRASIGEAVRGFDADDALRVLILTGAGRGFCAGADAVAGGRRKARDRASGGTSVRGDEQAYDLRAQRGRGGRRYRPRTLVRLRHRRRECAAAPGVRGARPFAGQRHLAEDRRAHRVREVPDVLPRYGSPLDAAGAKAIGLVDEVVPNDEL